MNVESLNKSSIYDVLIIGGGPAGMNAAIYAKRKGLEVGLISERIGGLLLDTDAIENYLGFSSTTGIELTEEFKAHLDSVKVPVENEAVRSLKLDSNVKEITLENDNVYKTKTIIIATGRKPRKLNVPGEEAYVGRGVTYCAICDGPLFMEQDVVVVGGGNSAVEAVLDLSRIANTVTLVHRSKLRADQILIDEMKKLDHVGIKLNTQVLNITGANLVNKIEVLDKDTNKTYDIETKGLFVEIGYIPNTALFENTLDLNDAGEIIVDKYGRTNIKGVFAAGDVTEMPYKQIIMAAGEGAKCALAANDYLNTLNI